MANLKDKSTDEVFGTKFGVSVPVYVCVAENVRVAVDDKVESNCELSPRLSLSLDIQSMRNI